MTYNKVITFLEELLIDEITFYIGNDILNLLSDSIKNNHSSYLVSDTNLDFVSIAVGISMVTEKRVNVVMDANYMFKHFNSFLHAAASKCSNIFFTIIISEDYGNGLLQKNIFNSIRSMKGTFYEMGFLTHEYTRFFKNRLMFNTLKSIYFKSIGPAVGIIKVSNNKKIIEKKIPEKDSSVFIDFVRYIEEKELEEEGVELKLKEN